MGKHSVSLNDKYDLEQPTVLLNGTQALVRLMMMQKAVDAAAGLNTAGFVTGYRGSPLGAVDMQMSRASDALQASDIVFQPGLNEDLAATALWGTQAAELRGEGRHDGVFGLWYGKGPGVDRSGDAMRHANMAGTSPHGGVLMALGDDHTGESSTTCHQSDWALVDAYMPVLSPAGVQEILDFGLYGFALSRFSGLWAGLKLMKDTVEVTSVVNAALDRHSFAIPQFDMPEGGVNIRLGDHWIAQEERIINHKRFAAEAFAHANKIDKRVWGERGAKIGLVAAGKNWLDLVHALQLLGIDEAEAKRLGITTYKVGQTFPLDMKGVTDWAEGLDLIIVVEEKRKLIEVQIKEAIFDDRRGRRVWGWHKGGGAGSMHGPELFPTRMALDPVMIAERLGEIFIDEGRRTDALEGALARLAEARRSDNAEDIAARIPYFCAGCPHNTSTKVPEGSRAYAGIGCHIMALWMDRETSDYTHMGAEGANWVGEAPFSTRDHVFQNLGDGTYNHSGVQAIRFALMAGTTITYKILFNDAVAMTGGQGNDGGLTPGQIISELKAMGVAEVFAVYDEKEEAAIADLPHGVTAQTRDQLPAVQEKCRTIKGVSAIVYIQTCAAEKRRRRKRGQFPDPDERIFINTDICEGCGDCGVQSNCVAIVPVETELGRKRAIDQSACNKDFSCVKGFCPSFVTVKGAKVRKAATRAVDLPDLPEPELPQIQGTHNVVITGIGGTGVVTIGAVMAMAAHLDGKGAGMMEMAGLAQKGGAVHIHCRIANRPEDISAIRVATGEADALIGGDLVVSAGAKTLGLTATGRTRAVVNSHEVITGDFTRNTEFRLPTDRLSLQLEARLQDRLAMFDASKLAQTVLGDSIFSNMMVFGAAWQAGAVPIALDAIREAITLNGAAVERNLRAFELGRWALVHPDAAQKAIASPTDTAPKTPELMAAFRIEHLTEYQNAGLARRYKAMIDRFPEGELRTEVIRSYHKLLAYKDEYEVARMLTQTKAKATEAFEGELSFSYHLAPPILSKTGPDGRPVKRQFSEGFVGRAMPLLARFKWLRGTCFDPFGRTAERRAERALIKTFEADLERLLAADIPAHKDAIAVAIAKWPQKVRGFGPVKEAAMAAAEGNRQDLWNAFETSTAPAHAAE